MKLVVFDVDGTLTQTNSIDSMCYVRAVEEVFGFRDVSTDWLTYRNVTDSGILQELAQTHLGRPATDREQQKVKSVFCALLEQSFTADQNVCSAVPGGVAMIDALSENHAVAVATGCWKLSARMKLEKAGYRIHAASPLASADDALSREDILRLAHRLAKESYFVTEFSSVVYVGDGIWDARVSRKLNWPFIGIGSGEQARALKNEGAAAVVADYQGKCFEAALSFVTR